MSTSTDSNHVLDFALNYQFPDYATEEGLEKIVAFGDKSHKCPVYVTRKPPCSASCPADEDIRGYNNILRGVEGKLKKPEEKLAASFERIADKNPFPAVMGRVCPAPCEKGCNRQYVEETIAINSLEHVIGEFAINNGLKLPQAGPSTGKKVAIVGGGPAGLSAAYQLRRKGHAVTIFEAFPKLGGMVRYGILGYRVSRQVLDAEIQRILDLGVEVKTNTRVGKDVSLDQLRKDYDAVFVGVGAMKGRGIPIPGWQQGSAETTTAIDVLLDFELNGKTTIGKNVIVIGDGDVSMDAARISLRLGSQVTLLSAVAREEMRCSPNEYDEAVHEGTKVEFLWSSKEVVRDGSGKMTGLKVIKMERKQKGEDGWNHAIPFMRYKEVAGTEKVINGDMVIAAIGQTTDMTGLEKTVSEKSPFLQIDANFQVKDMPGVFGGGDAYRIDLITTAIGQGRKAAESIDYYVRGLDFPMKGREDIIKFKDLKSDYFIQSAPPKRTVSHPANVVGNYDEILNKLEDGIAIKEAERCMSCGLCFECRQCMMYCPQEAISMFRKNPVGEVMFTNYNRCVGCHICAEVCPTGYIDMAMGEDL